MADSDREKWDARRGVHRAPAPAPAWLAEVEPLVPRTGRALDLASGSGRVALWAAGRGLDVLAIDMSVVGLARVSHPRIAVLQRDLEQDAQLPTAAFALVTLFNYRQPSLAAAVHAALEPGGVFVAELATVKNLERHAHPSRRWLAELGELEAFASGLELIRYDEGWHADRHTVRLVARRP
jgi:SAM-dependent methyltransferase